MTVRVDGELADLYEVVAEGWLSKDGPWGRPADVLVLPDGSLLVSDDHAGAIYRITYSP
jgi:glucose/arabinose dehydrogenase